MTFLNVPPAADDPREPQLPSDPLLLASELTRPNARGAVVITMSKVVRVKEDALKKFTDTANEWGKKLKLSQPQTASELDELADVLIRTLSDAIIASGMKSIAQSGRSSPWWSDECREARKEHKALGDMESKKAFRRTIANAKRQFWQRKFVKARSDVDLYRILEQAHPWHPVPMGHLHTPTSLEPHLSQHRNLLEEPVTETLSRPFWFSEITPEEAQWTAITCLHSESDVDGTTMKMLYAAWPAIGLTMKFLYESSLKLRYVPAIFKLAEVILFPRPRRNPDTINEWRPIMLVWCLVEGLERLIVKQLTNSSLIYPTYLQPPVSTALAADYVNQIAGVTYGLEHTNLNS